MSTERDDTSWDADQLRRQLQAMNETDFEHLVGDLWELQGWDVDVSEQSADAGIDIRATQSSPYNRKVVIQAKRYGDNSAVSGPAVQQYAALKQQEGNVDESIIVTTSRFTGPAEKRAQELNVKLIDGEALMAIIESLDAYEVAEQYINYPSDPDTSAESDPCLSSVELSPEQRAEVEEYMDQDIDAYLRDDEYRATRAMERARERVELNPHDAKNSAFSMISRWPISSENSLSERGNSSCSKTTSISITRGKCISRISPTTSTRPRSGVTSRSQLLA